MPLTLRIDIVSAETEIYSGTAEMVVAPGVMGEMAILPRHAPLLARLKPGLVRVRINEQEERSFFISGGFLEAQGYIVTVLADTVVRSEDMDVVSAQAAMERTEKALAGAVSREDYDRLTAELKMYTALLRLIEQSRQTAKR